MFGIPFIYDVQFFKKNIAGGIDWNEALDTEWCKWNDYFLSAGFSFFEKIQNSFKLEIFVKFIEKNPVYLQLL